MKKATAAQVSDAAHENQGRPSSHDAWLDPCAPALSDSEDEAIPKSSTKVPTALKARLRFSRFRRIAFKAFTPRSDGTGHKTNIVSTTEFVYRQDHISQSDGHSSDRPNTRKRTRIFNSLKFKSTGSRKHVKKMMIVLKDRISASSPPEKHPKTWEEYHYLYAHEQINVHHPPLPPMDPAKEGEAPSAFQSRFYSAPPPLNERARQLALNRLGILGGKPFDATDEGAAMWIERAKIGDRIMEEGRAPSTLEENWEHDGSSINGGQTADHERSVQSPPETLEQHPVFRKMVKLCRGLFGAPVCILSIIDDDRQVFIAESGLGELQLGGLREVTRGITFCAHTILSGRKGFAVLDSHKDWRFENGPLTQGYGIRFYAGVPVMAPNLDGSVEAEANTCPIGTLCLLDLKPRESFSVEDRKKLVYLAEYARREIETWFVKKMDYKMQRLASSQSTWTQAIQSVNSSQGDRLETLESESPPKQSASRKVIHLGPISIPTTLSTASSNAPSKSGPTLFEDLDSVLKPKMRKVFDLATKLVGDTLDLSLVYLTAVIPYEESNQLGCTKIISGHNLPVPLPVFDAALHLRALRAPEGGLLYQNPSTKESEEASLQPKNTSPELKNENTNPYASAMIMAVGTESARGGGFVLAGYTSDSKRVFGAEDVAFMKQFAQELSRYTTKLPL